MSNNRLHFRRMVFLFLLFGLLPLASFLTSQKFTNLAQAMSVKHKSNLSHTQLTQAPSETALKPSIQQSNHQSNSQILSNIAYGHDPAQKMDVYLPPNPVKAPVLLMVHGGAWKIGDKASAGVIRNKVNYWVPKGYIVVSVNYRMLPQANPFEQAQDVAKALAFAQSKAYSWGADSNHFVLMGHSAGAHLVALLASSPPLIKEAGAKPWLGTIVLDSAALDVIRVMKYPHLGFYDEAFGSDPKFWARVSPYTQLNWTPKPMFLVCSTLRKFSCYQARQYQNKVSLMRGRAVVLPVALSHEDINQLLGSEESYTDEVEAFLKSLDLP